MRGCRRGQFSHLIAHFVWQPLNDAPIAPTRFRFAPSAVLPAGLRLSSSTGGKAKETKGKPRKGKEGKGLGRTHGRTEQTDKRPGPGQTLCSRCSRFFSPFLLLRSPTEREESSCCCTRLLRRRLSPSQLLLLHPRPLLRSRAIVCSLPFPLPSSQLLLRPFSAGQ